MSCLLCKDAVALAILQDCELKKISIEKTAEILFSKGISTSRETVRRHKTKCRDLTTLDTGKEVINESDLKDALAKVFRYGKEALDYAKKDLDAVYKDKPDYPTRGGVQGIFQRANQAVFTQVVQMAQLGMLKQAMEGSELSEQDQQLAGVLAHKQKLMEE